MSSRVGTAIPASRSTARSSAAVGLTRSIQIAFSGSVARPSTEAFFSEDSAGRNTENMENPEIGTRLTKDGVIGRPSLWIAEDFWVLRFRLMVKRGPWLRPQASEGEAQHGPFCWIGRIGQGDQHLHCG